MEETRPLVLPSALHPKLATRVGQFFVRLLALAGIDLILLLVMTILLVGVAKSVNGRVQWLHPSLGLPVAVVLLMLLVAVGEWGYALWVHQENRAEKFIRQVPVILRNWVPFLLIDLMYENLHDLSPHLALFDITQPLYRLDLWLFGASPAVWVQQFHTPLLTDLMSIFYAIYLALPLVLMSALTLAGRQRPFEQVSIAVAFTFVLGFVGYVLTPALPPRFYTPSLFADFAPLQGLFIYRIQEFWDGMAAVKGAAFPSLHVALSTAALIYAFRFRRLSGLHRFLWRIYIPLTVCLWLSTVYLRHHWVGDIAAGWAVAFAASRLSDWMVRSRQRLAEVTCK